MIGENIKNKRLEYDIDQQDLAKRVGVTKAMMCSIETGVKIPSVAVLVRIADILHCSVDELLGRKVS